MTIAPRVIFSQPKWQGDLPELARPGTLFLGKASTGRDIGPWPGAGGP